MWIPSVSFILISLFIIYITHTMWTLAQLFIPPSCTATTKYCLKPFLKNNPKLELLLYTSASSKPTQTEVQLIDRISKFEYSEPFEKYIYLSSTICLHIYIIIPF